MFCPELGYSLMAVNVYILLMCLQHLLSIRQLNTFREDMEAKFALQATENKRLQEHITNLTEENRSIERRVVALEKSNKRLTEEVFGK